MLRPFLALAVMAGAFSICEAQAKTAILVNGLGVYAKPGMMAQIGHELTQRGYRVTYLNHIEAKYITQMPDVLIGHSMGANAILKTARRFRTYPAKLIVSIDAGRWPLWSYAPKTKARTIDIHCPFHPIGGQRISGAARNHEICGTAHIAMPFDPRAIGIIVKEVERLDGRDKL